MLLSNANKDTLAKLLAKENIFIRHSIHAATASFDIKAINNIEVGLIAPTFFYPANADYTASFAIGSANDGVTTVTLKSDFYLSGSKELLRFKTNRQLLSNSLLQEDKELVSPPKGYNLDLVIPNIDKTVIFPSIVNFPSLSYRFQVILKGAFFSTLYIYL